MRWLILSLLLPLSIAASPTRTIHLKKDEVAVVNTALGIATIIQVSDVATSVVLGDSAAFKVEYLNQGITIKPLRLRATSNLYISTNFSRFSVKLEPAPQASADYVVYLEEFQPPKPKNEAFSSELRWKEVNLMAQSRDVVATLARVAKTRDLVLFEIEIRPLKNSMTVDPAAFWVMQEKIHRPIDRLTLSGLAANSEDPVTATISLRKSDLLAEASATLEVRLKATIKIKISKGLLWTH